MYVEEVILDGFKSYSNRTVVSGFDPSFNAITGMNGSGKSNILDAICFVLGISNLSQVRVGSLQELVYKQGQAGISKASVTVVFNNSDKKASPVGYEQYDQITVTRQVVIGGKNKYLINGRTATLSQTQNMFHSVQLNVNNPHFLIMQGRITKVLNMKPHEILGMVEEAAGTRMYEVKKEASIKTMEKKDKKLKEIDSILNDEITPKLKALSKQREDYMKWSENNSKCEKLERIQIAYQYTSYKNELEEKEIKSADFVAEGKQISKQQKEMQKHLEATKGEIERLSENLDKKMEKEIQQLEDQVSALTKEFVKVQSSYENQKSTVEEETQALNDLEKNLRELQDTLQNNEAEFSKLNDHIRKLRKEEEEAEETLEDLNAQYSALAAGIASGEGSKTLTETLTDMNLKAQNLKSEKERMKMRVKYLEKELKEKKELMKKSENESSQLLEAFDNAQKLHAEAKSKLEELQFDASEEETIRTKLKQKEAALAEVQKQIDRLGGQLARFSFEYSDPEANFDRSLVKGRVANLLDVKDEKHMTAIEVCGGGRLYQVVVETAEVGKKLLENGKLKKRVTLIPLDKIVAKEIPRDVCKIAESIGGSGNVQPAIALIEFEEENEPAMKYVFGSHFICKDMDVAKSVTFHPKILKKSVTLDGDVFDPAGTLSGGSRNTSKSVLTAIQQHKRYWEQKNELEKEIQSLNAKLDGILRKKKQHSQLVKEMEMGEYEMHLTKERMQKNQDCRVVEEYKSMEEELQKSRDRIMECEVESKEVEAKTKELEDEMSNFEERKEQRMKNTEKSIDNLKKKKAKLSKELKEKEGELERKSLSSDEERREIIQMESEVTAQRNAVEKCKQALSLIEREVEEKRNEQEILTAKYEEKKEKASTNAAAISNLNKRKENIEEEISRMEGRLRKLNFDASSVVRDKQQLSSTIEKMKKAHKWIEDQEEYFGKENSDYDFGSLNINKLTKELEELKAMQDSLSRNVNKKVLSMFERTEEEYNDVMKKKETVEKDKAKIESAIKELDEKKREVISKTWAKVNKDFRSIFSTLLPGVSAKLEPPEGMEVYEGLEVRVAFNGVWKESLTELSGGQRSLLALSLILALLLFKPAPMYILDEVDAALDLSHTQNIGRMLKNHFKNSQFIVVSLKEGMFNNANVVFRTKVVNGQSQVFRTVSEAN